MYPKRKQKKKEEEDEGAQRVSLMEEIGDENLTAADIFYGTKEKLQKIRDDLEFQKNPKNFLSSEKNANECAEKSKK